MWPNGLAIWHSFRSITHIKVNNGHKSASLSLIELNIFVKCPPPPIKPHIFFYCNGLVIWHGFPDVARFSRRDLVFAGCKPILELIRAIGEIDTVDLVIFARLSFHEFLILGNFYEV